MSWLCAWLSGTHTSMHCHSRHCQPTAPPQPHHSSLGAPLSPFCSGLALWALTFHFLAHLG